MGIRSFGKRFIHEHLRPAWLRRLDELEQKVRFLNCENIRLNQLLRELIYLNDLSRDATGAQTKQSFDYQWRLLPDGVGMPSDRAFLDRTPQMILERTRLPADWFRGRRVLDAGCGSGRWTWGLLKLGAKVTCVDQSAAALESVRKLTEGIGAPELRQADLLRLDLPAQYELVWSFGVAHHTANLIKAMKNIAAAVMPGGYLFMMLYGYPEDLESFVEQASYEEWRRKLAPLPFEKKVEELRRNFPEPLVHGYFDAVSPHINDLVTWEWVQTFLQGEGFEDIQRTLDNANPNFVARRSVAAA